MLLTPLIALPALNSERQAFRDAVAKVKGELRKHKAAASLTAQPLHGTYGKEKDVSIADLFPAQNAFGTVPDEPADPAQTRAAPKPAAAAKKCVVQ